MDYDDMRDFQMREQYGDDYITPTRAYSANEWIEACDEHGEDVMLEVMDRDMARYQSAVERRLTQRLAYLESVLDDNDIEY